LPRSKLLDIDTTYDTTSSYIETLADLNIEHLVHQRNDAVESANDCRRRSVARHLLRKLAGDKRLTNPLLEKGPFKIGWDDLRPVNVLLNENIKIIGVVHWEFTYAVPAEFSYAPPWWLLIEKSEVWPKGIEDWTRVFDHHLKTFLRATRAGEDTAIYPGQLKEDQRLSGPMQQSWESGDFWISMQCRTDLPLMQSTGRRLTLGSLGPLRVPRERGNIDSVCWMRRQKMRWNNWWLGRWKR
jgi:hypothetical protein